MDLRKLGRTEIELFPIGLGAMPLSVKQDRPDEKAAIRVIHAALDAGVNLIDTADAYCLDDTEVGHNERLIGKALAAAPKETREKAMVGTKGGLVRPEGRWEKDGRPEHLREVCEASLKNLSLDAISLYQFHRPDPNVPLADSLGELKKLQEEGKIVHLGLSNVTMDQIESAEKIAEIVSVQNRFSPAHRNPETDGTLAICLARNIAFLPWSPLNGMDGAKEVGQDQSEVKDIASRHEVSPQALVLAWLLSKAPRFLI